MGDIMLLLMIQEDFPANQIGKVYSARITLSSVGSSLGLLLASGLSYPSCLTTWEGRRARSSATYSKGLAR